MYWCNCPESFQAAGHKVHKSYIKRGYVYFKEVQTKKDRCIHCGYTALFSKVNPNQQEENAFTRAESAHV